MQAVFTDPRIPVRHIYLEDRLDLLLDGIQVMCHQTDLSDSNIVHRGHLLVFAGEADQSPHLTNYATTTFQSLFIVGVFKFMMKYYIG